MVRTVTEREIISVRHDITPRGHNLALLGLIVGIGVAPRGDMTWHFLGLTVGIGVERRRRKEKKDEGGEGEDGKERRVAAKLGRGQSLRGKIYFHGGTL